MWSHNTFMPWVQVPAEGLIEFLLQLSWRKIEGKSTARDVAALMIYIVLLFIRIERISSVPQKHAEFLGLLPDAMTDKIEQIANITYDDLEQATGLSRSLIQQGLDRLTELGRISASGSKQKRIYILTWPTPLVRWAKLPCRAVANRDGVTAFKTFTLRNKHELNALKLYLYLASVRDKANIYSEVSYEVIYERLNIPERDIRSAINLLISSGLLARVHRESDRDNSTWGPNQYYLKGYGDLNVGSAIR